MRDPVEDTIITGGDDGISITGDGGSASIRPVFKGRRPVIIPTR